MLGARHQCFVVGHASVDFLLICWTPLNLGVSCVYTKKTSTTCWQLIVPIVVRLDVNSLLTISSSWRRMSTHC